jgi:hypothetical protein
VRAAPIRPSREGMSLRDRRRILEWEAKWDRPTGFVTFAAVIILIVSAIVIASVNGSGNAELLESAYEHSSSVTLSSILEAIGFVLLVAPLYFLFRATAARNDRVRTQLVGVIIAAPLFFGISGVLNGIATNEGAEAFHKGEAHPSITIKKATEECESEAKDKGAKDFGETYDEGPGKTPQGRCVFEERANDAASNALSEATYRGVSTGFGLAGRIGLAFALVYTCLFAMRTGLLSRFWGSLGMALGVAALLLLVQFCLIFFIYLGLLLVRLLPRGRPPAWAAGEAIPWETPGQRVAAELEGPGSDPDAIDTSAEDGPVEAPEPNEVDEGTNGSGGGPSKRKRKRRE